MTEPLPHPSGSKLQGEARAHQSRRSIKLAGLAGWLAGWLAGELVAKRLSRSMLARHDIDPSTLLTSRKAREVAEKSPRRADARDTPSACLDRLVLENPIRLVDITLGSECPSLM
ncbi:MAG: hypothetical protein M1815_005429 [Lichina confinis]|nr:MAG: hypothetical protein M1815_005429 [Lichina confinis]